jgi:hypothetical protein
VLVLSLMPAQPNITAHSAATRPTFDLPNAVPPQPAFNAVVAREAVAAPGRTAESVPAPVPDPAPTIDSQPAAVSQPDFVAHMADRGDRPQAARR